MTTITELQKIYEVNKGQLIFKNGKSSKHAFYIKSGSVIVFKIINDKKIILQRVKAGEVLGEMAIISGSPHAASAEAAEFSELILFDQNDLEKALENSLPLVEALTNQLITRLENSENNPGMSSDSGRNLNLKLKKMETTLHAIRGKISDLLNHQPAIDAESSRLFKKIVSICDAYKKI